RPGPSNRFTDCSKTRDSIIRPRWFVGYLARSAAISSGSFSKPSAAARPRAIHKWIANSPISRLVNGLEDLANRFEPLLELLVRDSLHGHISFDRQHGGGRCTLSEDHKHWFHPDRAIGDVARRHSHRHQQIRALLCFR